jgi:hypothetical protein
VISASLFVESGPPALLCRTCQNRDVRIRIWFGWGFLGRLIETSNKSRLLMPHQRGDDAIRHGAVVTGKI